MNNMDILVWGGLSYILSSQFISMWLWNNVSREKLHGWRKFGYWLLSGICFIGWGMAFILFWLFLGGGLFMINNW